MKFSFVISTLWILLILVSCNTSRIKQSNEKYIHYDSFYSTIKYSDIKNEIELKVIYFVPQLRGLGYFHPATVFGITTANDTIGVMDLDFQETLKSGTKILVYPAEWNETDKEYGIAYAIPGIKICREMKTINTVYRGGFRKK